MNRTLVAARIQLLTNWRWSLAFPLALFGFILLLNLTIAFLAGSPGFTSGGGVIAIYIVAATSQLVAMTQFFPFALGLSLTRREFYLGTWIFVLFQAVALGAVMTVLLVLERISGGWGVRLGFLGFGIPADVGPLVAWPLYSAAVLALAGIGTAFGVVFKRFGQLGVWVATLGLVLALTATAAYVGWLGAWPQVIAAVADPAPSALIGYPLLIAAVLGVAGWLGLRRATP